MDEGRRQRKDHPRICGEKSLLVCRFALSRGSPPHMRGKVFLRALCEDFAGITPAYAGKRFVSLSAPSRCQDHPRICGEKFNDVCSPVAVKGSPPHMRGKGPVVSIILAEHRITPAYAGKRPRCSSRTLSQPDHPRICGEKLSVDFLIEDSLGSPPHMRGKAVNRHFPEPRFGITPAYAGKRMKPARAGKFHEDHPRICGEKRLIPAFRGVVLWITPAYAGKRAGNPLEFWTS